MRTLFSLILIVALASLGCGGNQDAGGDPANTSADSSGTVIKPNQEEKGEVQQNGIEGRWQRQDGTILVFAEGAMKTLARNEVELRSEEYEIMDKSPCTEAEEGPYLVVKGGATTCWQLLRLDADP